MLLRQTERVLRARKLGSLLIATSVDASDAPIEQMCIEQKINYYRGSLTDVLDRFYQASKPIRPDYIVRLTGDCPLSDPEVIDAVINFCLGNGFDYASNSLQPTFPDGLDVEVFRFSCLETAWQQANRSSEREHVTPYIYQHPERFSIGHFASEQDLSKLRWTVDEELDLELVQSIYRALYPRNPKFSTRDILLYLDAHPELKTYNTVYQRNEGFEKSLQQNLGQ